MSSVRCQDLSFDLTWQAYSLFIMTAWEGSITIQPGHGNCKFSYFLSLAFKPVFPTTWESAQKSFTAVKPFCSTAGDAKISGARTRCVKGEHDLCYAGNSAYLKFQLSRWISQLLTLCRVLVALWLLRSWLYNGSGKCQLPEKLKLILSNS